MTLSTLNQKSMTMNSNDTMDYSENDYYEDIFNPMDYSIDPMDYPISEAVRTDGTDLYLDTNALIKYLQTDRKDFRRLRERGILRGHFKTNADFPTPILIKGRNYWNLSEVRNWEIRQARYWQERRDIQEITRTAENAMTKSLAALRDKLLDDC